MLRNRQPSGTPAGGQFAASVHTEAVVTLRRDGVDAELVTWQGAAHSRDPFLAGRADGARIALNLARTGGDLPTAARTHLLAAAAADAQSLASRPGSRLARSFAHAGEVHTGRAYAALYAARRTQNPHLGGVWAKDRAREDVIRIRREVTAPRRRRGLLARLGARP